MKKILTTSAMFALVLLIAANFVIAQSEEMTMEQYEQQLADWQQRDTQAKADIVKVEAEITALKAEIAKVDVEKEKEWQEILALLNTDEAGVEQYLKDLDGVTSELDGLAALSPEELIKRRKELDELEAKLAAMKESNISLLNDSQDKIALIEGKIAQLRTTLANARTYDDYTVVKGDYLWKISGKDEIYDDPYQWMRIYSYNKDQIKNPDLIYSDQILKIQREVGPNEYLVVKGDYLAKIAGNPEVYNDPTKWTKVFEANKDIVSDKNTIYPYQVLTIPD